MKDMTITDFYDISGYHYDLPEDRIAQKPADRRDASRLLVVDCRKNGLEDRNFVDLLDLISPGDLMVVNDTKVFPARLLGRKESGGRAELFILEYPRQTDSDQVVLEQTGEAGYFETPVLGLVKSSKRPKPGAEIIFGPCLKARIEEILSDAKVRVTLLHAGDLAECLARYGQVPLPPYIRRESGEESWDRERYQTVYARQAGAVAAPTAGLHFTESMLAAFRDKGVTIANITLHVGYGTFAPVRVNDIREHRIHQEFVEIQEETVKKINATKEAGNRIWAVGTTTVRALEWAATESGQVRPVSGWCELYIFPGFDFRIVDNLITNFHLPASSLLFMVSALAGRERIMAAYEYALSHGYRFYSYGDAMCIIRR